MKRTEPAHDLPGKLEPTTHRTGDDLPRAAPESRGPKSKSAIPRVALLLAVSAVLAGALLVAHQLRWWEGMRAVFSRVESMHELVSGFGTWAPIVFFLVQVAQVILAPIPGGVTVVVGTLLFGVPLGLALSVAGAVVGSALLFFVVRRWGRPLAVRIVGEENFERYAGAFDEKGRLLFVVMLVPFMPDDVVCALAGLSAVTFRRFVVLVAVGRTPSWALTALVTADMVARPAAVWATVGLVVVIGAALAFWYRERLEAWLLRRAGAEREQNKRWSGFGR